MKGGRFIIGMMLQMTIITTIQAQYNISATSMSFHKPGNAVKHLQTAPEFKLDSISYDVYYEDSGRYHNYYLFKYQYDAQLNPSSATFFTNYTWTGAFAPENKYELIYDSLYRPKERIEYEWNQNWMKLLKTDYAYDTADHLLQEKYADWTDPLQQWDDWLIIDYVYDTTGKLIRATEKIHDAIKGWKDIYLDEYIYNDTDNLERHNLYWWESEEGVWSLRESETYQYISGGYWVIASSNTKHEYTYDNSGNLSAHTSYNWFPEENRWDTLLKTNLFYSKNYDRDNTTIPNNCLLNTNFLIEDLDFDRMTDMPAGMICRRHINDKWVPETRTSFYYSSTSQNALPGISIPKAVIYPDPAQEYFMVNWTGNGQSMMMNIYDMQGGLISSQAVENNCIISTRRLSAGIYLVRLYRNQHAFFTGKLIVH